MALRDPFAWPKFAGLARSAEDLGYSVVFLPEIAGRDSFAALAGLAGETSRIHLATGIVPMTSRRTLTTAMGAATVHERSGGRMVLGIGTGPAEPGALERLRAEVLELKGLLAPSGGSSRISLELPAPVLVWVSALGPRSVRLAAEVADGVILNWCNPERVAIARRSVRDAAQAAGRDPKDVTIAVYVRGNLADDRQAGRAALNAATVEYSRIPAYARQFALMGLGEASADELVEKICLPGDAEGSRVRMEEFREAGADLVVVYPVAAGIDPAGSVAQTLEALAPG